MSEAIADEKETFGSGKDKKDITTVDKKLLCAYVAGEVSVIKEIENYEKEIGGMPWQTPYFAANHQVSNR